MDGQLLSSILIKSKKFNLPNNSYFIYEYLIIFIHQMADISKRKAKKLNLTKKTIMPYNI